MQLNKHQQQTNSLAVEPQDSTILIPKPTSGHDCESAPSTSYLTTHLLKSYLNIILLSPS